MPTGVYKRTAKHRAILSHAKKGKMPKNFYDMQKKAWEHNRNLPEHKRAHWKGDKVGYHGVHIWIRKHYGQPKKCEECGTRKAKRYEWANISREYKRDRNDFRRLCGSCHRKEGYSRGEYKVHPEGCRCFRCR